MERRLILALIISILILTIWSIMFPQPRQKPLQEIPREKVPLFSSQKEQAIESQPIVSQYVKERKPGRDIVVDVPLYKAIFSTEGGVLTSFQLKKYPERMKDVEGAIASSRDEDLKKKLEFLKEKLPEAQGVEMVSPFSSLTGIFPLSLFWQGEEVNLNYSDYEVDKAENNLIFSFRTDKNLKVIKKYTLREDTYLIDIDINLINEGKETFRASPLLLRYGPGLGLSTDPSGRSELYYRCLLLIKEAGQEKIVRITFPRSKPGTVLTKNYPEAIWGGMENKYFLAVILPPAEPYSYVLEKDHSGQLHAGIKMQMPELVPGGVLSRRFSLYLGPKQKEVVNVIGKGLEKSIDYGMLAASLRIMEMLRFFYHLTKNWGLAIIMLTILTKVILVPLSQKSLRSMEKMQSLQPRMKEIRIKYKDDPRRQQKELMEFYRQQGVNPMGGCLPMLLQMPIFIALFTTLRNTIDLRGARFLWIKDLSLPDTVYYTGGIPINPLPLAMGLSMFLQQKMSTVDPEQAKMMMFMPILFTFMFYNFSSGLVLYWFVQNLLTIAHQYSMRIHSK